MTLGSTKEYAAGLVLMYGVIGLAELLTGIREAGLQAQPQRFNNLHEEFEDIVRIGDFYISTDLDSRVGKTLRLLKEVGVVEDDDLRGGIRRALGVREMVPRGRRAEVAAKVLEVLRPALGAAGPLKRNEMAEDKALVELLHHAPGGVMRRDDLEAWIVEHTSFDDGVRVTYSPVLEMVANGVFGIRGAAIDVAAIESLRNSSPGPWSVWGRLDRHRLWIGVKTKGQEVRVRIPADCREVLEQRTWILRTIAGGQLGTLCVTGERELTIEWAHKAPPDWTAGEHVAVLEFNITHSNVKLLAGANTSDEFDHRLIDGCVLVNGRWHYVFVVDDFLATSGAISLPRAVSGLDRIEYGHDDTFVGDDGLKLTACREPHAIRVSGLGSLLRGLEVGSYVRLGFSAQRCDVAVAKPPKLPSDILSRYAGVFVTPDNLWPTIGKALGVEGANRQKVRDTLADRERFDLNDFVDSATSARALVAESTVSTTAFSVNDGTLLRQDSDGQFYAERAAGGGPLGLVWGRGSTSTTRNDTWARYSLLVIRAWGAAAARPDGVCFTRLNDCWTSDFGSFTTLRDGLENLASRDGEIPLASLRRNDPMLPLSTLGYATAFSVAEARLRAIVINDKSWTGITEDGGECGPTPLLALLAGT